MMNSLQQLKLTQFVKNQKETGSSVARSIASLNNDMSAAIEQQAYARANPDDVIDADLLAVLSASLDELLMQFEEVDNKRLDILAVRAETMTVDALIAKYGVDLATYSNSLL